jgi:RNA recognition motif-containing protein
MDYFQEFGSVKEAKIILDNKTNESRGKIIFLNIFLGFGFVQFENLGAKEKVLAREQHSIDGKLVRIFFLG